MHLKYRPHCLTPHELNQRHKREGKNELWNRKDSQKRQLPNRRVFNHQVCMLGPGQIFGEEGALLNVEVQYTIRVISDSAEVIKMTQVEFKKLMRQQYNLKDQVLIFIKGKLSQLKKQLTPHKDWVIENKSGWDLFDNLVFPSLTPLTDWYKVSLKTNTSTQQIPNPHSSSQERNLISKIAVVVEKSHE